MKWLMLLILALFISQRSYALPDIVYWKDFGDISGATTRPLTICRATDTRFSLNLTIEVNSTNNEWTIAPSSFSSFSQLAYNVFGQTIYDPAGDVCQTFNLSVTPAAIGETSATIQLRNCSQGVELCDRDLAVTVNVLSDQDYNSEIQNGLYRIGALGISPVQPKAEAMFLNDDSNLLIGGLNNPFYFDIGESPLMITLSQEVYSLSNLFDIDGLLCSVGNNKATAFNHEKGIMTLIQLGTNWSTNFRLADDATCHGGGPSNPDFRLSSNCTYPTIINGVEHVASRVEANVPGYGWIPVHPGPYVGAVVGGELVIPSYGIKGSAVRLCGELGFDPVKAYGLGFVAAGPDCLETYPQSHCLAMLCYFARCHTIVRPSGEGKCRPLVGERQPPQLNLGLVCGSSSFPGYPQAGCPSTDQYMQKILRIACEKESSQYDVVEYSLSPTADPLASSRALLSPPINFPVQKSFQINNAILAIGHEYSTLVSINQDNAMIEQERVNINSGDLLTANSQYLYALRRHDNDNSWNIVRFDIDADNNQLSNQVDFSFSPPERSTLGRMSVSSSGLLVLTFTGSDGLTSVELLYQKEADDLPTPMHPATTNTTATEPTASKDTATTE